MFVENAKDFVYLLMHKLKLFGFGLVFILFAQSCSLPKTPDFERLEKLRIVSKNKNLVTISAEAVYMNGNDFGGRLKEVDMNIIVEGVKVTHLNQDKDIDIQPKKEFRIPITFTVDLNDIFKKNEDFLKQALKSMVKEEIEILYKGTLKVTLLNTDLKIPVNFSEKLHVGLNWE
ncbi:MAG: LEA14-like dessication related protein [Bacteroidia bacterium]